MGMVACFSSVDSIIISRLESNPEKMPGFLYPDSDGNEPPNYMDVDKSWHCIHYMLTEGSDDTTNPLNWAIFGGDALGEDVGYGPARIVKPSEVETISSALSAIDEEKFKSRYAPVEMQANDIYLAEMCVRDGDEALGYLVQNFRALVDFYHGAATRGEGVILWVS
jgi:hypothetical protein